MRVGEDVAPRRTCAGRRAPGKFAPMRLPVVTILAGLLLLHLAAAQDEPEAESALEKARAEAVRATIGELEALADFCVENKLLLGRDLCFEVLIRFDPDHRRARKTLKYVQGRDGTWEQKPYRRPTNKNVELEPEFYERYDGILSKLIKDLHAALAGAGKEEKPEVRELVIDAILAADPDDVEAHRLRGEVSYDGQWVLEETASAKERLPELRRFAKRAIDEVETPKPISPDATEEGLGLTWTASFMGEWWRGLGTVNAHEIERAVRVLDASLPFFNHALGVEMHRPRNCGFYLLRGKDDAALALRKHPSINQSRVNYLLTLRAAWVPGKHFFFQWSDNATVRLDGSARMALGLLFMKKFNIDIRRGWVWEGMGLYLDYLLTGSHRTIFVTPRTQTTAKRRSPWTMSAVRSASQGVSCTSRNSGLR